MLPSSRFILGSFRVRLSPHSQHSQHGVRDTSFDDGHRFQGDSTISSWAAGWFVRDVLADTII